MFQKKPNLPARPAIPDKEEILEDLNSANSDDIVFSFNDQSSPHSDEFDSATYLESLESSAPSEMELNDPNKAYLKVASFVEKMNHLERSILELQKKKESLIELEQSLRLDMDKVEGELKKQTESDDKN